MRLGLKLLGGKAHRDLLNPFSIQHLTFKIPKQYGAMGNLGSSCVSDISSQQAAVNGGVNEAADSHSGASPTPYLAVCSRESHVIIRPHLFKHQMEIVISSLHLSKEIFLCSSVLKVV